MDHFLSVLVCAKYNLFSLKQKLPKVNKELALKLMEEGDDEAEVVSRKKKGKVEKQDCNINVFDLLLMYTFRDHNVLPGSFVEFRT